MALKASRNVIFKKPFSSYCQLKLVFNNMCLSGLAK